MANQGSRHRNWCFTINNPEEFSLGYDYDLDIETWKHPKATYIVMQLERGEENTPHLQGYVELNTALRLSQVKQWQPRAHFIPANGTATDNKTYCTKREGRLAGPWEWGVPKQQGKRNDLALLVDEVKKGTKVLDIILMYPWSLKYVKHLQYLKSLKSPQRRDIPCIIWLYGGSGLGKSTAAHTLAPDAYIYCQGSTGNWWNAYDGERTVIFDEFDGKYPLKRLQSVLDVHPYRVEVKGSAASLVASNFIITSNEAPASTYCQGDDRDPLQRRLDNWALIGEFVRRRRDDGEWVTNVIYDEPGDGWRARTEKKEVHVTDFFTYLCAFWEMYSNKEEGA